MKIAILGGGSGAHAMAADLALAGHEIRLAELPEMADNVAAARALGGIELTGVAPMGGRPGFARLALVTTDIRAAVAGAQAVMLVVPAYGHEAFMQALVDCAEDGQLVVIHSGYFGTLVFARMLAQAGRLGRVLIAETASLIYLTRLQGGGRVWIKAGKRTMPFAAFPASCTEEALRTIGTVYPQFVPAPNVLATSLSEAGLLVHPVTTLLNLSRIEQIGPYRSSFYDMTPGVGRIMDAVDAEKQGVQRALRLDPVSLPAQIHAFFGVSGEGSYAAVRACPNYSTQMTPDSLQHRYITEDVPYGLVPLASLGERLSVPTPATNALIHLAAVANGQDYRQTGRTLARMGLAGMDAGEIINYVAGRPS